MESLGHLGIQFLQHFFLGPVEVHIVLDAFEVGAGDPTGIAQEVGDVEDLVGLDDLVGFGGGGSIGAFGDDAYPAVDLLDRLTGDLTFQWQPGSAHQLPW